MVQGWRGWREDHTYTGTSCALTRSNDQMKATVMQPPSVEYDWLGRPKPPTTQPRYLPQPNPTGQPPQWNQPPILLEPTPLPQNIDLMSWSERRYWHKVRDEQLRGIKLMQKAAQDAHKAQMKEAKAKQKAMDKERVRELKYVLIRECHGGLRDRAKEKQLKWLRKHPHRNLPQPSYPLNTAPAAMHQPPPRPDDPLSFMLLPTGEEFGVRRPFNAPGLPSSLGGPPGHAGWPMMSRTMTHVSQGNVVSITRLNMIGCEGSD